MPLNLEATEPQEHPDVTECKRKILQLAREHSRRFHCGDGAEEAVRAAGLMPPSDRRIQVVVDFSLHEGGDHRQTRLTFDEIDLIDKSEAVQNAFVQERLRSDVGDIYIGPERFALPIVVHDLNLVAPPEGVPVGYVLRFTGSEGRVAHIVRDVPEGRRSMWDRALCGAESYGGWAEESPRASGHTCTRCSDRAARILREGS